MINQALLITGLLLLSYGLICILLLTRSNVNNLDELKAITSVFNISQITGWIITGLLLLVFAVSVVFPPLKIFLFPFQSVLFTILILSLTLSIMNTIFYKQVTDTNSDYGKNVVNESDVEAAKKDYFIRFGIVMVVIGSACLSSFASSMMNEMKLK